MAQDHPFKIVVEEEKTPLRNVEAHENRHYQACSHDNISPKNNTPNPLLEFSIKLALACLISLSGISVYVGVTYDAEECQHGERHGIHLRRWLVVLGMGDILFLVTLAVLDIFLSCAFQDARETRDRFWRGMIGLRLLLLLVWCSIGTELLFTEEAHTCLIRKSTTAILVVLHVMMAGLSAIVFGLYCYFNRK